MPPPMRNFRHLTTIRRKIVSPISTFLREEREIKRRHVFFFIDSSGAAQAEIGEENGVTLELRFQRCCRHGAGNNRPAAGAPQTYAHELSFSVADHLRAQCTFIYAGEMFLYRRGE